MNRCILVFGMPRSGTTWIGKLFDSHPDTLYRHEPDSVRRLSLPLFPEQDTAPQYRQELERFVDSLPRMRSPEIVGKQPLFPKAYQSAAALFAYRASVLAAKSASRFRRHFPCPYRPTAARHERARIVWKSIESVGRLGVCIEALPDARAFHLMRHPCGYIASMLRGEAARRFVEEKPSANGLWVLKRLLATATGKAHGMSLEEFRQLTIEERLAWRWILTQEKILADIERSKRVLTVRYEDVCANPVEMTRKMFAFADLAWQPQTEGFIRASTEATDTSYYSVFKQPQASAGRWRSELSPVMIERVLRIIRSSPLYRFYADDAPTTASLSEATA